MMHIYNMEYGHRYSIRKTCKLQEIIVLKRKKGRNRIRKKIREEK